MSGFILKAFTVRVDGYGEYPYFTASRGKALAKAWRDFGILSDISFKGFLSMARVSRRESPGGPFGAEITVGGAPAFFVSHNPQYVQFVRPGSDVILNSHPYDVEPEHMRPSTYRSAAA